MLGMDFSHLTTRVDLGIFGTKTILDMSGSGAIRKWFLVRRCVEAIVLLTVVPYECAYLFRADFCEAQNTGMRKDEKEQRN